MQVTDLNSIAEFLGWVFGAGGLASFFLYRKANDRAKNAEADKIAAEARLASAEADRGVIDNYEKLITRYESYAVTSDTKYDKMKEYYDKRIDMLEAQLEANTKQLKAFEEELTATKKFVCYNMDCTTRRSKPTIATKKPTKKAEDEANT